MKTPIINNYNYNNIYYSPYKPQKQKLSTNTELPKYCNSQNSATTKDINFTGFINNEYLVRFFRLSPLRHFQNFTAEEYSKLSKQEINRLRYECRTDLTTSQNAYIDTIHDFAATCLKSVFDKRFGENNYIVITLGRSLSSIGKVLGYKIGEDNVKNIPLSSIGRFYSGISYTKYQEFLKTLNEREDTQLFNHFLKLQHLDKQNIKNSGKNYILIDFCSTGISLKGAEQLFKSDLILGNNKNIYAVDFIKLLEHINPKSYQDLVKQYKNIYHSDDVDLIKILSADLYCSKYKRYATAHHICRLKNVIDKTPTEVIKQADRETKLIWFKLLDYQMSKAKDSKNLDIQLRQPKHPEQFRITNQKVEPWHDIYSQYENDLRNNIVEIIKTLTKFEELQQPQDVKMSKKYNKLKKDLYTLYNHLCEKYKDIHNLKDMSKYYYTKKIIDKTIQDIQNTLSQLNT